MQSRVFHSIVLLFLRTPKRRTAYVKKHHIFAEMGDNCVWGPWKLPLYPKLVKLGNNVRVHKTDTFITHDVVNRFLQNAYSGKDFSPYERVGCIELKDNVSLGMNVLIMPDVKIGTNCIISSGSVVATDIPDNSVAAGNPAQVISRFDRFASVRYMSKGQNLKVKKHQLSEEQIGKTWDKFETKRKK